MRPAILAPHGLWLPLVFLAVSTAIPPLGHLALEGIGAWSFAVVFFGALAMPFGSTRKAEGAAAMAIVAAVGMASPVLTAVAATGLGVPPTMRALMVLAACAPIAQSIGAIAAIVRLPGRSASIAALTTALASPIVLPLAGHLLAHDALPVSVYTLTVRTAALVMAPAVLAFGMRRTFPATLTALRGDFSGLVILALSMFAAARGPGLLLSIAHPVLALHITMLACTVTACAMIAGAVLTWRYGHDIALAGLLATGMRNVPAAWAAIGTSLSPEGIMFMTLTVVPFYLVPTLIRHVAGWTLPARHEVPLAA